jgi:tetratricopeptide (TPR) repeat protein
MRGEVRAATALVLAVVAACAIGAGAQAAPDNAAAKAAFVEGERSFQLGKFDAAIEAYERAFGIDPQPAFLFNIALAHRRQYEIDGQIDHLARARELYRNYLKLEPQNGNNRPGVEKLIAELTAKIDLARGKSEALPQRSPPGPVAHPAALKPAAPAVAPAPAALAPATEHPAAVLSAPAGEPEAARPASRKWVIGGTIAAAAVVAVIAIFFVTRGGTSFDGPGVDVTPRMTP